MKLRDMMLI